MIISFGWTWPAFIAKAKTVTRRQWKQRYAARWQTGMEFDAYDRRKGFGGKRIGRGVLVADVRLERIAIMPDSDYEAEGFAWLAEHRHLLPKSARGQKWAGCTREAFEVWRSCHVEYHVVRFRILAVDPEARQRLEELTLGERCGERMEMRQLNLKL